MGDQVDSETKRAVFDAFMAICVLGFFTAVLVFWMRRRVKRPD